MAAQPWAMRGWVGIAAYVILYDSWAGLGGKKTLSAEFRDHSLDRPVLTFAVTTYLVAHLFGKWPRKYDPLCQYTNAWGIMRRRHIARASAEGLVCSSDTPGLP